MRFDWRVFDELKGYEVKADSEGIHIRTPQERVVTLTAEEFNRLRGTRRPFPGGLD
jgi:hypothetical protein